MSNMNKQQELEATISQLSEALVEAQKRLDELKAKPKWQPQGVYSVLSDGTIARLVPPQPREGQERFGNSFPTYEAAEEAAKQLRVTYRLLAYVAEFAPGFKQPAPGVLCPPDIGVVWRGEDQWFATWRSRASARRSAAAGLVCMPYDVAVQLAEKLNSGEVEL